MTTLDDHMAIHADHRRLSTAARRALDLLDSAAASSEDLESVRRDLREALDDSEKARTATEEASTVSAATALIREGKHHGWWKALGLADRTLDEMDPIGREEFLDLVARILKAADLATAPVSGGDRTGPAETASLPPPPADENVPLSMDELIGIFGPTMPMEAGILIRDNPDGMSIAEIRAELRRMAAAAAYRGRRLPAFLTHDDDNGEHRYYLGPESRAPAPYRRQRHVEAVVDVAADGSFAGVELIGDMPPPYRG